MLFSAPRLTAVLFLVGLMAVPGAAADGAVSGQLIARSLAFEQPATQEGTLMFFHATQGDAEQEPTTATISGHHVEGAQYTETGYEIQQDGTGIDTLRALNKVQPNNGNPFTADSAHLTLAKAQPGFLLNIFADQASSFMASLPTGTQQTLQSPQLLRTGIGEAGSSGGPVAVTPPAASALSGGGSNYWSTRAAATPHVLTQANGAGSMHLRGTFTVEVIGIGFHLSGSGVERDLESGTWRTPLVAGAPENAHGIRQDFLRIVVTDGVLDLELKGASLLQWSGPAVDTKTGAIGLDGATGSILRPDGQWKRLDGSTYHLEGNYDLQANPSQQGLQLGVTGLDAQGNPLAPATNTVRPVAPTVLWVVAFAAVAASTAITFLVLALRRRQPSMADLEAALETGHFRRAARDAAAILRKRPGFEDAVISRSIALSKLGQNRRVVREIDAHFAAREPSDGVLHYVLGLALKDLGELPQAEVAWKEAVRRTPDLLPQVRPLLSGQQASSPPTPVVPVVDGTAYA